MIFQSQVHVQKSALDKIRIAKLQNHLFPHSNWNNLHLNLKTLLTQPEAQLNLHSVPTHLSEFGTEFSF